MDESNENKKRDLKDQPFWVTHPEYYPNGPESHLPPKKKESIWIDSIIGVIGCATLIFMCIGFGVIIFGTPFGWLLLIVPLALMSYAGQKHLFSEAFQEAHIKNEKAKLRKQRMEKRLTRKAQKQKIQTREDELSDW